MSAWIRSIDASIGAHSASILDSFFLIFSGAAVLAALALYSRQPLLVAYIIVGALFGPHGFALISDASLLAEVSEAGIIFLLFLVGLDLQPAKLRNMFGESMLTGIATTALFFAIGYGVMQAFGFTQTESWITGIAVTFSSTIVGIKLLPTSVLHHRHIGEIVVSLLLIQDLIAILALILIAGYGGGLDQTLWRLAKVIAMLPLLIAGAVLMVRFVLLPLLRRFDAFHEFIFLLAIGWCLGIASVAQMLGLSLEIGAFVAGVTLATSPISQYIAESLRPLRDFFLVLFFFTVGAGLDISLIGHVLLPTLLLGGLLVLLKPPIFALLLRWQKEDTAAAWEVGFRLGQASEFSLLVSYVAIAGGLIGVEAGHVIQGATILTLVLSTYLVIFRYPSPIAVNPELRRD